jgi:hypothetical protein
VYVFIVNEIWEWPRTSITTRGDTPCARSSVAQLWRRSWNRRRGQLLEPVRHHAGTERIAPAPGKEEVGLTPRFAGGEPFSILTGFVLPERTEG